MVLSLGSVGEPAWVIEQDSRGRGRGPVAEGAGLGWFKKEAFCSTGGDGGNFCRVIPSYQSELLEAQNIHQLEESYCHHTLPPVKCRTLHLAPC